MTSHRILTLQDCHHNRQENGELECAQITGTHNFLQTSPSPHHKGSHFCSVEDQAASFAGRRPTTSGPNSSKKCCVCSFPPKLLKYIQKYVEIYIYIHVFIYSFKCIYHIFIFINMYTYIYIYIYMCVCVCTRVACQQPAKVITIIILIILTIMNTEICMYIYNGIC